MMRRKGFILAEILTGLMIQAWFIVTLCGAFYLLLTFSNRIQQSNAAQDHGQRVIAYVDARIRNAGLGLWGCVDDDGNVTPESIFTTLTTIGNSRANYMQKLQNLHLPVAVTSRDVDDFGPYAVPADGIYSGDVLTLLYAHRDFNAANKNNSKLVISLDSGVPSQDISGETSFTLIGKNRTDGFDTFLKSSFARDGYDANIKNYAVIERSGVPVKIVSRKPYVGITPPSTSFSTRIYNMSELLPLECERMYVTESSGQRSFMIKSLGVDKARSTNAWNPATPHTAGILEIYMELNVSPDITPKMPIFTLKVLVSEGKSDSSTPTPKPADWPQKYWKPEFETHNVHISQASWRLPNLAPIDYR